jgi:uridine kinase
MEITLSTPTGSSARFTAGISAGEAIAAFKEFSPAAQPGSPESIVALFHDNRIIGLRTPIEISGDIAPVLLNETQGHVIYRRTLNFLLAMAARRSFPDRQLNIGHSIGDSMFFSFPGYDRIDESEIQELQISLAEIIDEDLPIHQKLVKHEDCEAYFSEHGRRNSLLLLGLFTDPALEVQECGEYMDLDFGPLLPSTGIARNFELQRHSEGLVLMYPPWREIDALPEFHDIRVLTRTYSEYHRWAEILQVDTVGKLNALVRQKSIKEFMWVAEALQNQKLANIAGSIAERSPSPRLVLIAGPSSSGKTTFAKRLEIQLLSLGLQPMTLSLDNYFVSREKTPLDEDGNYDFESIEAIDVALLNEHLLAIIAGEEVEIPSFNFKTGTAEYKGHRIHLPSDGILIMEGIHGLNEALTPRIPRDQKFRIYISALTQINLDEAKRISTTDNRLIRRMVRDYRYRGYSAEETLMRWPSVRRGEKRNIFPYQDMADAAFNSALDYELGVLKLQAESLLRQIKPASSHYGEARRLLQVLQAFLPISREFVPDNSILREFVGGSAYKY